MSKQHKKDLSLIYGKMSKLLCLSLVLMIPSPAVMAASPEAALTIGQNYTLASTYLKEDRPYSVYLPDACKTGGASAPCPMLYILDGERTFHHASGVLETMSLHGQIPQMIMVAIANTADRTGDLTPTHSLDDGFGRQDPSRSTSGGGERFLDFIEHELIPEVEERYKPMPYRILVGHSFGGLITLHSLVNRPALFQGHIAIDSSLYWDNNSWLRQAEAKLEQMKTIKNRVYVSVAEYAPKGNMDISNRFERPGERFSYALKANQSPHLQSTYQQFAGEDHGSVGLPSLYYGLKFVFDGYKNLPPSVESQGLEAVKAYYRDYLGLYGIALSPPMAIIANLALTAELNNRYDESIAYHTYNIKTHPKSAGSHYALAETYRHMGKTDQATIHYKKVVELHPKWAEHIEVMMSSMSQEQ
ncbi:alpha/beta hydrolase-fold protein [Paremcibacter congregatus]|uniref:Uncharacterized protein n=1 Tax=Paremcibacter congregatus TaxID=2043170 RepID=A0A2G4YT74_9PROT|nr:alpha/beta hydrolase-fold protein [Paremcibacter congregatus]PHZ85493.1 hypothetical protein CRD36_06490 [Paremcibacter congregatus]QDE27629.1 hypothetical protein FIV45_10230 [Paremcibacter congregatus]